MREKLLEYDQENNTLLSTTITMRMEKNNGVVIKRKNESELSDTFSPKRKKNCLKL